MTDMKQKTSFRHSQAQSFPVSSLCAYLATDIEHIHSVYRTIPRSCIFNSPIDTHHPGFGDMYAHKSCKQVHIRSLRNLIRESNPLKDKDTERDKTVIKPRASETISRPSSRERGDVTMEG